MAAATGGAHMGHSLAPLGIDWQCGVCLEMLSKPCVAPSCGHIYCFWCVHKSMDGYDVSRCPICRTPHEHLPRVCTMLNSYLLRQYPAESAARAAEIKETEAEWGMQSSQVDELLPQPVQLEPQAGSATAAYTPDLADFSCSRPGCGQLLLRARVPVCGHPVCSLDCLARADTAGEVCCPLCRLLVTREPAVCRQLGHLVADLFPEAVQQAQQSLPVLAAAEAAASPAAVEADSEAAQPTPEGLEASFSDAGNPAELSSGSTIDLQRVLRQYVHFGVGCDCCGAYPIRGKRYKCLDCPEEIGFDLCESCHRRGRATFGRFNQKHVAEHRMEEQRPIFSLLQLLKAAHPELSFSQIRQLLHFASVRRSNRSAADGAGADGQQADAAPELDADAGPSQPAADASGSDGYGSDSEGEGPDDGVPAAIVLDTATAVGLFDLARQLEDQQQAGASEDADGRAEDDAA